jgi:hypothetical protein
MIGDYTFTINGLACQPIYTDDLTLVYSLQPNAYFYKRTLSGELSFVQADYEYIMSQPFNTRFNVNIYKSGDLYFKGYFTRIDCKENKDDKVIKVALLADDPYDAILNGYSTAHNIIPLKPVLQRIQLDKRPILQTYVSGSSTVSCLLSGNYWEQEVTDSSASDEDLANIYHFRHAGRATEIQITAQGGAPTSFNGTYSGTLNYRNTSYGIFQHGIFTKSGSTDYIEIEESTNGTNRFWFYVVWRNGQAAYSVIYDPAEDLYATPTFTPDTGGYTGTLSANISTTWIWARYLTNVKTSGGEVAMDLPENDLVTNNRNYKYALIKVFYNVYMTPNSSTTPTGYGRNADGNYFAPPSTEPGTKFYPIAKDKWINASIWLSFQDIDPTFEVAWRSTYTLKDAYDLVSVIDLLLKQINPDYYFTEANSQFLYGGAPIKADTTRLFLTQKTNILRGEYDQPAQKAEVSLKQILDMLDVIYQCKWHMEGNALHIEHISYYKNGRTYYPVGAVSLDLREEAHVRHYKSYTFQANKYSYDKSDAFETLRSSFSDSVTDIFQGEPLKIISPNVNAGKVEEASVSNFNPDVDYMLLNPNGVNNDGFALLAPTLVGSTYTLPYVNINVGGINYVVQNGYLSFYDLVPKYHTYDVPSKTIEVNGEAFMGTVKVKKTKKQSIWFTSDEDLPPARLVKTNEGNGLIEKMEINLISRRVDLSLRYDTY